jgi:hypothetical protein
MRRRRLAVVLGVVSVVAAGYDVSTHDTPAIDVSKSVFRFTVSGS